jgi:site-specific DNA recombinase
MVSTSSNPKLGNEKPRCLIYARVSDEEQANKTFSSVDAQLAGGRRLAEDESLSIFEEIADEGASGKNLNRPGMKRLISILKTERISVLIASRLDRLSRDAVHTEYLIQLCSDRGTKIQLLQQTLDEETASGRMGRRMNSVFSQYEREAIGDRVRYKIGELARKGMRAGGWTPPGYVRIKEHEYVLPRRQLDLATTTIKTRRSTASF